VVRLASLIQGILRSVGVAIGEGFLPVSFHDSGRRALVQAAEEGLYWLFHSVRPYTDPHSLWDDPEVLRLYEVDGAVVARCKDWFVKKLVCDLYWQFGGRAPSALEFNDLVSRTTCTTVGAYAAMSEIRQLFQQNPSPATAIQTRWQARAAIVALFPEYPVP
jgi:hypothetical protein